MAKKDRLWIMVDVNFWETDGADLTVEAQSLWLKCLAFSKKHRTDGSLTPGQLEVLVSPLLLRSNGNDPSDELIAVGLLLDADGSYIEDPKAWKRTFRPCTLRGWFDWNDSAEIVAAKSEIGRRNALVRWGKDAKGNAKPNARVKRVESREEPKSKESPEVKGSGEKSPVGTSPAATRAQGAGPLATDAFKDALLEGCHLNAAVMTKPGWRQFNDALKEIKSVGGTPDQIRERCAGWEARGWTDISPSGIARKWADLARSQTRQVRVDPDENTGVDRSGKEPDWEAERAAIAASIAATEEVW